MPASFLRPVPLFGSMGDEELARIEALTLRRTYPKGRLIIAADTEGDTLFIVHRGQVKVSSIHVDGREIIYALLGAGEFFGELALLDGRPRSAHVTATRDTELIALERAAFLKLISSMPQIAIVLLEELASRLRRTDCQVEDLALLDVANRVSRTLLRLAVDQGMETERGILLKQRPTHQQLAHMAGTTRETVTRVLGRLEAQGYIASEGRTLLILREEV